MAHVHQSKKNITVLGAETEFSGELSFKDDLIITGSFNGSINATGNIEISKEAVCTVDSINANKVIVAGKVKGNINANEYVEMKTGSSIEGNVATGKIRIEDGVNFQGRISMVEDADKADLFVMNSSEYKDSLVLHKVLDNK